MSLEIAMSGVDRINDEATAALKSSIELLFQAKLEQLNKEKDELKAQVAQLRAGVVHFNRSGGDMNPLLTAYISTPAQCLANIEANAEKDAIASFVDFVIDNDMNNTLDAAVDKFNRLRQDVRGRKQ